jgi:hypothetical protein
MRLGKLILVGCLFYFGCCSLGPASVRFALAHLSQVPVARACRVEWTMENGSELVVGLHLYCPRLEHPLRRHPIDRKF